MKTSLKSDKYKKTLLETFVDQKLNAYKEPQREGTPKGEPIGFSKSKFHACLLTSLSAAKKKRVAEVTGVSYGLVRKWTSEAAFKKSGEDIINQFIKFIEIEIIKISESLRVSKVKKKSELLMPYFKTQSIEVASKLRDVYAYNISLYKKLIMRLFEMYDSFKKISTPDAIYISQFIMVVIGIVAEIVKDDKILDIARKGFEFHDKIRKEAAIELFIKFIGESTMTNKEKAKILYFFEKLIKEVK